MRKVLKLHPHQHTGKVIHHRHTSYRALMLVLVAAGALMVMTSQIARATDLLVSATVPAPIPTGAPVFTAPPDGSVVTNPNVTFEGTCPVIDPAIIVALYDGATLLGSDQCDPMGTFSLVATISAGQRTIVAKVVTITGDYGDTSDPLTITYNPPVPPTPPTPPATPGNPPTPYTPGTSVSPGLEILADNPFITFGVNAPAVWKGSFQGGTPPYTVTIDWGDGTIKTMAGISTDPQSFLHSYAQQTTYEIVVTLTDNKGNSLTRRYAATSLTPGAVNVVSRTDNNGFTGLGTLNMQLYTLFVLLVAVTLLLWGFNHFVLPPLHHVPVPIHSRRTKKHSRKRNFQR